MQGMLKLLIIIIRVNFMDHISFTSYFLPPQGHLYSLPPLVGSPIQLPTKIVSNVWGNIVAMDYITATSCSVFLEPCGATTILFLLAILAHKPWVHILAVFPNRVTLTPICHVSLDTKW
uniref:Uncharacterized protein n=1 Tax=Arundo donax TaxID=35708 RepID=A0A0A9DGZ9_ARUDO